MRARAVRPGAAQTHQNQRSSNAQERGAAPAARPWTCRPAGSGSCVALASFSGVVFFLTVSTALGLLARGQSSGAAGPLRLGLFGAARRGATRARCGSSLARVGAPRRLYTAFALRPAPQQTVITERRQSLELRVVGVPGGFNLPHIGYLGARGVKSDGVAQNTLVSTRSAAFASRRAAARVGAKEAARELVGATRRPRAAAAREIIVASRKLLDHTSHRGQPQ